MFPYKSVRLCVPLYVGRVSEIPYDLTTVISYRRRDNELVLRIYVYRVDRRESTCRDEYRDADRFDILQRRWNKEEKKKMRYVGASCSDPRY